MKEMTVGTLVEYVGIDRMTCEDHRNRSYPLTKGLHGQVVRKLGFDVLVRWDFSESHKAMPLEWHRKTSVKAI